MEEIHHNGIDEAAAAVPGAFLARVVDEIDEMIAMNHHIVNNVLQPPPAANNNDGARQDQDNNVEEPPQDLLQRMPSGQNDSRRMDLSAQEHGWAIAIKQAIEADPDLESLTDFLYAQIALIDKDDLDAAVERAHQLQYFRHEYDMTTESLESSDMILREYALLFPGYFLALSFNEDDGNYVLVVDVTCTNAQKLNAMDGAMRIYMCAHYLSFHACCPDFESIRRGMCALTEYEGFSWKKNFGLNVSKTFWLDLITAYPFRLIQLKNFHTGVFANLLASMSRSFIPNEMYSKFHLGCVSELGRLDTIFLSPNANVATERVLTSISDSLCRRYANEASFRL